MDTEDTGYIRDSGDRGDTGYTGDTGVYRGYRDTGDAGIQGMLEIDWIYEIRKVECNIGFRGYMG